MAYRLEGIDPFGDNVELDEGILNGKSKQPRRDGLCFGVLSLTKFQPFLPGLFLSVVLNTSCAGQSLWVEAVRIEVELSDGSEQVFFKNVVHGPANERLICTRLY